LGGQDVFAMSSAITLTPATKLPSRQSYVIGSMRLAQPIYEAGCIAKRRDAVDISSG
jgi:hypothetical protein